MSTGEPPAASAAATVQTDAAGAQSAPDACERFVRDVRDQALREQVPDQLPRIVAVAIARQERSSDIPTPGVSPPNPEQAFAVREVLGEQLEECGALLREAQAIGNEDVASVLRMKIKELAALLQYVRRTGATNGVPRLQRVAHGFKRARLGVWAYYHRQVTSRGWDVPRSLRPRSARTRRRAFRRGAAKAAEASPSGSDPEPPPLRCGLGWFVLGYLRRPWLLWASFPRHPCRDRSLSELQEGQRVTYPLVDELPVEKAETLTERLRLRVTDRARACLDGQPGVS